ncbi:pancreatic secretory granule membrane major glycoprotein GP2-like [Littorina saxatilis]|uniref:Uncharacterized protein n=1 Tax=Littorina saxatilis TaxID=31220 RepID=A0AAN9ALI2_9CAEN
MSPLFILVTGWVVVGAAGKVQSETYNGYRNGAVAEDIVVQSPAVSPTHCGSLCQQQDGCEAFTFDERVCRGYRSVRPFSTTGQSASKAQLFVKEIPGPCKNYTVMDDVRRDVNNGKQLLCDRDLSPGWYRFFLNGADAVMPTYCVPKYRCGTDAPYWLDLQGGELPAVGHETPTRACGHGTDGCCAPVYRIPVTVRNCGAFYLYKLKPTAQCHDSYCAKRMNN